MSYSVFVMFVKADINFSKVYTLVLVHLQNHVVNSYKFLLPTPHARNQFQLHQIIPIINLILKLQFKHGLDQLKLCHQGISFIKINSKNLKTTFTTKQALYLSIPSFVSYFILYTHLHFSILFPMAISLEFMFCFLCQKSISSFMASYHFVHCGHINISS